MRPPPFVSIRDDQPLTNAPSMAPQARRSPLYRRNVNITIRKSMSSKCRYNETLLSFTTGTTMQPLLKGGCHVKIFKDFACVRTNHNRGAARCNISDGSLSTVAATTCSNGLQFCLEIVGRRSQSNPEGCRSSYSSCMKTGSWVGPQTGRRWPVEKK